MKVIYYTLPSLFDVALPFIAEMSHLVELHVVLQMHPMTWKTSMFDLASQKLPQGLQPAGPVLDSFPESVKASWSHAASVNLVMYGGNTSLHPSNWWISRRSVQFIRGLHPDVVHLEGSTGRIIWGLAGLKSVPLVITVHDPEPHPGEKPLRKLIVRRLTFSLATRFIFHNHNQASLFCTQHGISPEKVDIIPMGANYLFKGWVNEPVTLESKTILFFGRLSPYKGLEILYQAAPSICEHVQGVRFIVAGRAVPGYQVPQPPVLPNGGQIERLDGYISNIVLARLFQRASVIVCPYTQASQSAVVLTAYAFGKPVVATRIGGLPEYVNDGKTGILVQPNSPEALADGLVDILNRLNNEPDLRQYFAKNILEKCNTDLAWDRIAEKTLRTYEQAHIRRFS